MLRTHTLGELTKKHIDTPATLAGWVHRRRNHGGLIFVDLRDRYGLTQIVFNPAQAEAFTLAEKIRPEWVLQVTGVVRARPEGTTNKELTTGEIEVGVDSVTVLSEAQTPPFEIDSDVAVGEERRLEYRYLDLRREGLRDRLLFRSRVVQRIREVLTTKGFAEIETPLLTSSSPEGARDYLVPSRLHPGKFYALPQAPQQFKQLLMVGGFDKYFQIARALRDEDLRGDRQPEHTQMDLEMSFVEQDDVLAVVEDTYGTVVKELTEKTMPPSPWPRLTYQDALARFGTDKPDLRFGMELQEVTEIVAGSGFKVFTEAACVKGMVAPGMGESSRSALDTLIDFAKEEGAHGLAWIKVIDAKTWDAPIMKFISDEVRQALQERLQPSPGDLLLFVADEEPVVAKVLGSLRSHLGHQLQLADPNQMAFAWIVDFPMYEYDETTRSWDFGHNPFSMLQGGYEALQGDIGEIKAYQYDLVCNGYELASGAIRNHDPELLRQAFHKVGYDDAYFEKKFGHFTKAFAYGTPPHGGMAPGLDRFIMLLTDQPNIREVIAFPKTQRGEDLMMNAPSDVDPKQLKDLHIRLSPTSQRKQP